MSMRESREQAQDLDRLDLGEIKRFLARRWTIIVGTATGAAVLALLACLSATPIYTATSQVILDPSKQRVFGQDAAPDVALDSAVVDSQIPIILSTRTLSSVVMREHLMDDPEFASAAKPGLFARLIGFFAPPRQAVVEPPLLDGIDPKLAPVITRLFTHVDVSRIAKSNVLSITVNAQSSQKAARLANAMAQAYVADQVDVHAKSVQQAANFFEERLGRLRDQVRTSERAVADFRNKNGLATTTDEKITVSDQQLTNLNERLALASSDTAEKLAKYQQAAHFRHGAGAVDTLPEVVRSPVITQLRTQQADIARREADLAVTYGNAYPALAQIRAQRKGLDAAIAAEMQRLVVTLKNDYDVAKEREDSLRKTMASLSGVSGGDSDVGVKLRELERTNLANKALFENFLNRAKLTQEASTFEAPDARLISPALEPSAPSSPKTKLIVPVAAVAGLLLGLALGAMLDLLRGKPLFRGRAIVPPTGPGEVPIFGYIPAIEAGAARLRPGVRDAAAFMSRNPRSAFADAVRDVGSRLSGRTGAARVLMLAPVTAGAGCSALALCFATALGATGQRVLVIDADGRGRALSKALDLATSYGLGDVLAGTVPVASAVAPQAAFACLPAGVANVEVASTAGKRRMRAILAQARGRFDVVLVDGAACDTAGTHTGWSDLVDGFFLIASAAQLLEPGLVATVDAVMARPSFAGLILNRTAAPARTDALAIAS